METEAKIATAKEILSQYFDDKYRSIKPINFMDAVELMEHGSNMVLEKTAPSIIELYKENERLKAVDIGKEATLQERINENITLHFKAEKMAEALRQSLQMLEQTSEFRKANDLTVENIFLISTIEEAKKALTDYKK